MEHLKNVLCVVLLTGLVVHTAAPVAYPPFILPFSKVLARFVDQDGLVDYRELKAAPADLEDFIRILKSLEAQTYESFSDQEKLAFWINAYNALTLKVIIDHYPIRSSPFKSLRYPKNSIRQISGAWERITFPVMGEPLSLNQIEHGILRKEFEEPRVHMALVCAARGCPPLRREPFAGSTIETQLDDQVRIFLSDPRKFFIEKNKHKVYLSSIFKWYGKDFLSRYSPQTGFEGHSPEEKAVLHFISLHISEKQRNLLMQSVYKIKYMKYDWTLNERVLK